jgi:cyclopropane fatty-acyl-phospholipid synthase-like methyltransferase
MRVVPFVVSPDERLATIFKLVKVKKGMKSIDLGAGDGRIVIAMAKRGAQAYGIELRKKYAILANRKIKEEGLKNKACVYQSDFWNENLKQYDIITIYGMADIMIELEKKLSKELKKGAIVISNGFRIPGWKSWKEEEFIYVYKFAPL